MYYYIVCKFYKEKLGKKSYVYEVSEDDYFKINIGYRYRSDRSMLSDSVIEITGMYSTDFRQVRSGNFLKNEFSINLLLEDYIKLKFLSPLIYEGKSEKADFFKNRIEKSSNLSCIKPIVYLGKSYEDLEEIWLNNYININWNSPIKVTSNDADVSITNDGVFVIGKENEKGALFTRNGIYEISKEDKEYKDRKSKGENNMSKIFGNLNFGEYLGSEIKMSMKGMCYLTKDCRYVAYDKITSSLMDVTDFVFDADGLVYLIPVSVRDVKVGDIIDNCGNYVIVTKVYDNILDVIDPKNKEIKKIAPVKNIFGFDFYTKAISLIGETNFDLANMDNPFGNMLPFILMSKEGKVNNNLKDFILMNAMNSGNLNLQNNPLLMMMLLDGDGGKNRDMLPFLLMGQNGFNLNINNPTGANACDCYHCKDKD